MLKHIAHITTFHLWMGGFLLLTLLFSKTTTTVMAVTRITSKELHDGIVNGRWDVVIDTRRQNEWNRGHIPNATFMLDLQTGEAASPDEIINCKEACTIVVYCNSGSRAQLAAERLEAEGFPAPVYNGLGIQQWIQDGRGLVNTSSQIPLCKDNPNYCNCTAETKEECLEPTNGLEPTSGVQPLSQQSTWLVASVALLISFCY